MEYSKNDQWEKIEYIERIILRMSQVLEFERNY